ncbi:MAG: hypothetical protein V8Q85_02950 [Christensenellales bacterium]
MDDAIIGVLVGGGLGVATQVLISIVNWASQCRQFRHEETMRRIEIFEAARVEAIAAYSEKLALIYENTGISPYDYYPAAGRVLPYVSQSKRELIYIANAYVENWMSQTTRHEFDATYQKLVDALSAEVATSTKLT